MSKDQFKDVNSKVDFIKLEHEMLKFWKDQNTFNQLRLKNKGMKHINSSRYGDQYVKIMINIPKKISKKTHNLLSTLSSEIGDNITYKKFND